MKKVFLSQPMRGLTEVQIRRYREEAWEMIKEKLEPEVEDELVLIDSILEVNKTPVELLGKSISLMKDADFVVMLPNWENSRGCRIEKQIAIEYAKEMGLVRIYTLKTNGELQPTFWV